MQQHTVCTCAHDERHVGFVPLSVAAHHTTPDVRSASITAAFSCYHSSPTAPNSPLRMLLNRFHERFRHERSMPFFFAVTLMFIIVRPSLNWSSWSSGSGCDSTSFKNVPADDWKSSTTKPASSL